MKNGLHMPKFDTENVAKSKNSLEISDEFLQKFDLKNFLKENVIGSEFFSKNDSRIIKIETIDDLIKTIIDFFESKKYVGVGVGGVYILDIENKPHVLLYKRYHEPENQVWSILGGSGKLQEKIEDTLKRKISRITSVPKDSIDVKDIILVNNHQESGFHYLSPAFYVEIINPTTYLCWKSQRKNRKKISVIKNVSDFQRLGKSTYENTLLAWVPIEMIDGQVEDEKGNQIFSFTTIQAIRKHRYIYNETSKLIDAANKVGKYKEWRVGKS